MDCPIRMVSIICDVVWNIYIVLFRKMGFGHQEDIYFLDVEKNFYFFYALAQPFCIPRCYVVYLNYFTNLLSRVVRSFMSVLICSTCLDKIVSNFVKGSYIILISVYSCVLFTLIVVVSILFLGVHHFRSFFSFLWCCRAFFSLIPVYF
jgi:hypothetical protein